MQVEVTSTDTPDALAPAWHVAKSCGVTVKELVQTLKRRGVQVVLDDDLRPSFVKAELYALISGTNDAP